jgi:streptogramin lyase
METCTMFLRLNPLSAIRGFDRPAVQHGRRTRPDCRPAHRTRTRARFQFEGLEERCLLSVISAITEFPLPSGSGLPASRPQAITTGPDGNIWFTDPGANAIGMINPTTHAISLFTVLTANAGLQSIAAGPDGNLWFTEGGADKIGEISPTTHAISEFTLPTANAGPRAITAGPDGNLWFTEGRAFQIGEINPTTHAISEFAEPIAYLSGGVGITAGPDGNVWFEQGILGKISPATHVITEFENSWEAWGISPGPDGNVWFTSGVDDIGMINLTTDAISTFITPTEYSETSGITAGPDGNLWFTEQPNPNESTVGKLAEINPTTDAIVEYAIPYASSSPTAITTGPDGNLWFTDPGTNAIGVATLTTSQLVVTTQPPASVTAGSGFGLTVTAENNSGSPITTFNGTVTVALANNPGGATLGGTLTATASNGVATFSGLSLTTAASGYTLDVSGSGLGAGVTSAITVTPATATQVVITQQPPATVKVSTGFGLQASIEDQYGNVVTTATNTVSVALANNPTGATLGGTLSVSATQGVATFSALTINKTGNGYTLRVSSTGLSSAVTSAIDVTKNGKTTVLAGTVGTTAPDPLLAPLVSDSPDFLDSLGIKKRARRT